MKVYGYCRISTAKQSLTRQVENISKAYPTAEVITEVYTGTKSDRPMWCKLKAKVLKQAAQGEEITIVFDSVSRMSRDAVEGFSEYKVFYNNGVNLVFLKEPYVNTDTYKQAIQNQLDLQANTGDHSTDELINTIIGAIQKYQSDLTKRQIQIAFEQAQKEVDDLHTRTAEGMRASGAAEKISKSKTGTTYKVKKSAAAKQIIKEKYIGFGGQNTVEDICKIAGISRNTFFKYRTELIAEGEAM